MSNSESTLLEERIDQWRSYLLRRQAIGSLDVIELEDHLREQIDHLMTAGLDTDEAFLVAVKRLGALDALSREYAVEHSERLWKQMVLPDGAERASRGNSKEAILVLCLAVAAALLIKLPVLFGLRIEDHTAIYARNISFFVLPILTGYFAWKRGLRGGAIRLFAAGYVLAAVFANVYPFSGNGNTEMLTVLHLPISLWLMVGMAYAGSRWNQVAGRMDFIRFSGELFIYYVLIALGGGVLTAFSAMIFDAIGVYSEDFIATWLLPCGASGAVIIAAWLVEAKKSVIENMAPVLTRLFTPLFAVLLLVFLGAMLWTGRPIDVQRDILIAFDLLLVVVLGLLLYAVSARDPLSPPGPFDVLQVVLVIAALLANGAALWAIAARISEFGFSPNKVAALGENVVLLINLAWSAVLYIRFLRRRGSFAQLERWQTDYLPVYAIWAALVVIVFPPLFGYA
ncbi:MAG: hypothetical protein GXX94_05205 [Chloroflexi bacterium]|nr:hypothetical protein [Chloroflexota bacterium]